MWDLLQKAVTKKLVCRIHLNIPVSLPQGRQSIQMLQRCHFDWYDWTDLRLPLILTAARYELLVQLLVIGDYGENCDAGRTAKNWIDAAAHSFRG